MKGKYKSGEWDELEINFYLSQYKGDPYRPNTIEFFSKLSLEILRANGFHSFIVPDRLAENVQYQNLREFILTENAIRALVFRVPFPNIIADTLIYVIQKSKQVDYDILLSDYKNISQPTSVPSKIFLSSSDFAFFYIDDLTKMNLILRLLEMEPKLSPDTAQTNTGFIAAKDTVSTQRTEQTQQVVLKGENISRYQISGEFFFNFFKKNLIGGTQDPNILSQKKKILIRKTSDTIFAAYVENSIFPEQSLYQVWDIKKPISPKYVLTILNSKLIDLLYKILLVTNRDTTPQLKKIDLDRIPIRRISFATPQDKHKKLFEEAKGLYDIYLKTNSWDTILFFVQQRLSAKPEQSDGVHDLLAFLAEQMIGMSKEKNEEIRNFVKWLQREIKAEMGQLTNRTKLKAYHNLKFDEFLEILKKNKKKIPINLSNREFQTNLKGEFDKSISKLKPLTEKIERTDNLINHIVYKLYGLTDEEIRIVESSLSKKNKGKDDEK